MKTITEQKLKEAEETKRKYKKCRKALETIRNAYYTDGETSQEQIDDLKAIASNTLYEIDNDIPE